MKYIFTILLALGIIVSVAFLPKNERIGNVEVPSDTEISSGHQSAQSEALASKKIFIQKDEYGISLQIDGQPFMINGMNWDYIPIGTNYSYNLWEQPEDFIKKALESEMTMLKDMGVNTIRQYTGVPAKWIEYIYEEYGIYTMLNHPFGRYGVSVDGGWVSKTDYGNQKVRDQLLKEVKDLADQYKDTPGVLMFLLGNENNYGLFWEGSETEDFPSTTKTSKQQATKLYQLFNEAAIAMKAITTRPVGICNGDLQFLKIIKKECPDVDIFGTNIYRGASFGDSFKKVKRALDMPILITEFGTDAYNAAENREDQSAQSYYLVSNWKEIYENAAGLGMAENSIGGFTFQFSDGWWKYGQDKNLSIHDTNASWSNGGYKNDFRKGENNMNEEWFGICAKGPTDHEGMYELKPREAYYSLQKVHKYDPFRNGEDRESCNNYFEEIGLVMVEDGQEEISLSKGK